MITFAPERFRPQRATAELLFLETYYDEKDYKRTIELGEEFFHKYLDCKREYSAALCKVGMAYALLGKHDESIGVFLELYNMHLRAQDRFYHYDLQKGIIGWLVWNYDAKGDKQNADYWRQRMDPNWRR